MQKINLRCLTTWWKIQDRHFFLFLLLESAASQQWGQTIHWHIGLYFAPYLDLRHAIKWTVYHTEYKLKANVCVMQDACWCFCWSTNAVCLSWECRENQRGLQQSPEVDRPAARKCVFEVADYECLAALKLYCQMSSCLSNVTQFISTIEGST